MACQRWIHQQKGLNSIKNVLNKVQFNLMLINILSFLKNSKLDTSNLSLPVRKFITTVWGFNRFIHTFILNIKFH